ncbi:MAG: nuclear transport factor 2 family protein [Myxococcota bacterium]|nr:nuclear transport factor 2 family protein [Myxococcota bacterium]
MSRPPRSEAEPSEARVGSVVDAALAELVAKEEIRSVLMRLARGTDRRDPELIRSCYHPDGFDDHGAFQGSPAEFAEWVPKTLALFASTQHVLGNVSIELEGDVARSETYCTAHHVFPPEDPGGPRDAIMGLRYLDRFERRPGSPWLIARRVCAYDYTYIVPISESWPLDPPFIVGRPDRDDPSYDS